MIKLSEKFINMISLDIFKIEDSNRKIKIFIPKDTKFIPENTKTAMPKPIMPIPMILKDTKTVIPKIPKPFIT